MSCLMVSGLMSEEIWPEAGMFVLDLGVSYREVM